MNTTLNHPIVVTAATFAAEVLGASYRQPVLVDFWAEWCGPCKMLAPTLREIAEERSGRATIAKVDVDAHPELASQYSIRAIPALLIFRDGQVVDTVVGVRAKADILSHLDAAITGVAVTSV
jgi:thioredoxin